VELEYAAIQDAMAVLVLPAPPAILAWMDISSIQVLVFLAQLIVSCVPVSELVPLAKQGILSMVQEIVRLVIQTAKLVQQELQQTVLSAHHLLI